MSDFECLPVGTAARLGELEQEVEQIKKNRDYWFESCQQAQLSRDLAIVENSFFEADIKRLRALFPELLEAVKLAHQWLQGSEPGRAQYLGEVIAKAENQR